MPKVAANILISLALVACFDAELVLADGLFRTVAVFGQPVPGFSPDVEFYNFNVPTINNAGQVGFNAEIRNTDYPMDWGVWIESGGTLRVVAHSGTPAPGTEIGDKFASHGSSFGGTAQNNAGKSAVAAPLNRWTDYGRNNGIWTDRSGQLQLVARQGDHAPGMPSNIVFDYFRGLLMNDAGKIVFLDMFDDKVDGTAHEENRGIWSNFDGLTSLVANTGGQAPGIAGAIFRNLRDPRLNNTGQIAFWGLLQTGVGSVSSLNDSGIWSDRDGAISLIAREGEIAPGVPGGKRLAGIVSPFAFNGSGRVAFRSGVAGDSQNATQLGIWSDRSGSLALIARGGDYAPGTPPDTVFDTLFSPTMNEAGQIAFVGTLQIGKGGVIGGKQPEPPRNDSGIWIDDGSGLKLLARLGDHAPDLPDGAYFSGLSTPMLNNQGQAAFLGWAALNNGTATPNYWHGIWASDRAGKLRLVVRNGDMIDIDDGPGTDLRTIVELEFPGGTGIYDYTHYYPFSGTDDGRGRSFNDSGQIAFLGRFSGGNGVFVAEAVAVPEPNRLALVAIAIVGGAFWPRKAIPGSAS